MTINKKLIDDLKDIIKGKEGQAFPPAFLSETLYCYDFKRNIGKAPIEFWAQYKEFVAQMDGFNIDGFCIYGISDHPGYKNNLFHANKLLTDMTGENYQLLIEDDLYCIEIGSSSLDDYMYDVRSNMWEARDKFQHDNLFISCHTLEAFLYAVFNEIRQV